MEHKPAGRRFIDVFTTCMRALQDRRDLARNERWAVEIVLKLTYGQGYASLPVASPEDLAEALELGGRQNVYTLLRRLLSLDILRWNAAAGNFPACYRVNPDPHTWGRGLSTPASVERATRATAARARLLHHAQLLWAQGDLFPEASDAEWEAEAAQERVTGPDPSELTSAPAAGRHQPHDRANPDGVPCHNSYDNAGADCHNSYDNAGADCHNSYDKTRENCHKSYDKTAAPTHAGASECARPRQNHEDVTESNHDHGSDARGLAVIENLHRFWGEVKLDPGQVGQFGRCWARRILVRPLRVERCLHEARVFRDGGGQPRKGWGEYLDYLFKLGLQQERTGGRTATDAAPSAGKPPGASKTDQTPPPGTVTDEERQRQVAAWREQRAAAFKGDHDHAD